MNLPGGTPRAVAMVTAAMVMAGGAALLVVNDDDDGSQEVATDATTSSTEEPTTTTTTTLVVTTTVPAPVTVATAPATTATTRPATTTTKGPTRTWSISPTSGPSGTQVTASGVGCTGTDAGVALRFYDPSGQEYNGDGASAQPDGTWSVPFPMTGSPGRYKITAECSGSSGFRYTAPQYFTIT